MSYTNPVLQQLSALVDQAKAAGKNTDDRTRGEIYHAATNLGRYASGMSDYDSWTLQTLQEYIDYYLGADIAGCTTSGQGGGRPLPIEYFDETLGHVVAGNMVGAGAETDACFQSKYGVGGWKSVNPYTPAIGGGFVGYPQDIPATPPTLIQVVAPVSPIMSQPLASSAPATTATAPQAPATTATTPSAIETLASQAGAVIESGTAAATAATGLSPTVLLIGSGVLAFFIFRK